MRQQPPRSDVPAPGTAAHIPALDGLRGIAILAVLVLHFSVLQPHSGAESLFFRVAGLGWAGVDLFFVLSGFLITGILLRTKERPHYFRNFYVRRTLRIFPLYYAYLVLIFLVIPAVRALPPEPNHIWLWTYMGNVLMSWQGWEGMPDHTTHLWSLAVEEQFYMIWPLIVLWANEKQLARICVGAVVLAIATRVGLSLALDSGVAGYLLLPARLDPLAIGALIAVLVRQPESAARLTKAAGPVALAALAVLVGLGMWESVVAPTETFLPPLAFPVQLLGYSAIAVVGGGVLITCLNSRAGSVTHAVFTSRFLTALGRYSYAIYLLHIPPLNMLRVYAGQSGGLPTIGGSQLPVQVLVIVAGVAGSYLVALVSWNLFEKHFLALKDRLAPARAPSREEAPALVVTGV